jgi:hypothetical protein
MQMNMFGGVVVVDVPPPQLSNYYGSGKKRRERDADYLEHRAIHEHYEKVLEATEIKKNSVVFDPTLSPEDFEMAVLVALIIH